MPNYWVFCVAPHKAGDQRVLGTHVYYRLMTEGDWGLKKGAKYRTSIVPGDEVLFYMTSGNGRMSYFFHGRATVQSAPQSVSKGESPILIGDVNISDYNFRVALTNIVIWKDGVPIQPLIGKLSIIKDKGQWGRYLQGGVLRFSKADYDLVMQSAVGKEEMTSEELRKIPLVPLKKYERIEGERRRRQEYEEQPTELSDNFILHDGAVYVAERLRMKILWKLS